MRQAIGVVGFVLETGKGVRLPVQQVQAFGIGSNPEIFFAIFIDRNDSVLTDAMYIGRIVLKMYEPVSFPVKLIQASFSGTHPQMAGLVFQQLVNIIMGQATRISGLVPVMNKLILLFIQQVQ